MGFDFVHTVPSALPLPSIGQEIGTSLQASSLQLGGIGTPFSSGCSGQFALGALPSSPFETCIYDGGKPQTDGINRRGTQAIIDSCPSPWPNIFKLSGCLVESQTT